MDGFKITLILGGMLATLFALLVIIYYLLLTTNRRYLSTKAFYILGITVFISVVLKTLAYIFLNFDYLIAPLICGEGVISTIAFFVVFWSTPKIYKRQQSAYWFSAVVVIALLLNLFVPAYLSGWIERECDSRHQEQATPIIRALNEYKIENGVYPTSLHQLTPEYISEIPIPSCFSLYRPLVPKLTQTEFLRSVNYKLMMELIKLKKIDYYVVTSEWYEDGVHYEEYYLYVLMFDLNHTQRYNFLTKTWENNLFDD